MQISASIRIALGLAVVFSCVSMNAAQAYVEVTLATEDGLRILSAEDESVIVLGGIENNQWYAFADKGVLKIFGEAVGSLPQPKEDWAFIKADFITPVTISTPGIVSGYFHGTFELQGSYESRASVLPIQAEEDDWARRSALVQIRAGVIAADETKVQVLTDIFISKFSGYDQIRGTAPVISDVYDNIGSAEGRASPFGLYNFIGHYVSGVPFDFGMTLSCVVEETYLATAICDLDQSAYFRGFQLITDENGVPISDFEINSPSGLDFRIGYRDIDAVPEPASWAMLIAGFGLIGASQRRRRRTAMAVS